MDTRNDLIVKMAVRADSTSVLVLISGEGQRAIDVGSRFVPVNGCAFKVEEIISQSIGEEPADVWVKARNVSIYPNVIPHPGTCRTYLTSKE